MTSRSELAAFVAAFGNARVLCIGDAILDHFIYGSVERISPEAPIPVLRIEREDSMLGGAGNVVRNLVSLGAEVHFVPAISGGVETIGERERSNRRCRRMVW